MTNLVLLLSEPPGLFRMTEGTALLEAVSEEDISLTKCRLVGGSMIWLWQVVLSSSCARLHSVLFAARPGDGSLVRTKTESKSHGTGPVSEFAS